MVPPALAPWVRLLSLRTARAAEPSAILAIASMSYTSMIRLLPVRQITLEECDGK